MGEETYHVPDIGMCVGAKFYPWPEDFKREVLNQGLSKAVAINAIPRFEPGETRIVLAHPRAIVRVAAPGMYLFDLALELANEYVVGTDKEPPAEIKSELVSRWLLVSDANIKDWKLAYVCEYLVHIDEENPEQEQNKLGLCNLLREAELDIETDNYERLVKKYGIEFCGCEPREDGKPCKGCAAWFGWTFLTGAQYVCRDDETELPPELVGTEGLEAVRIHYVKEKLNDKITTHGPRADWSSREPGTQ